jgi:hypothetical protein
MHGPINIKSPNNIIKWQMGFNSAFKGLNSTLKSRRTLIPAMLLAVELESNFSG